MSVATLTREELEAVLGEIDFYPEVKNHLDGYLNHYVQEKDLKMVKLLLNAGANPNPKENLDCYLHHLFHEYKVTKTTSGELALEVMEVLLRAGANPNRVWCNNFRAYDYAANEGIEPVKELLLRHGAISTLREYI